MLGGGFREPDRIGARLHRAAALEAEADRIRARVEEALGPAPVAIDELIRQLGAPAGAVLTVLLELELAGRCAAPCPATGSAGPELSASCRGGRRSDQAAFHLRQFQQMGQDVLALAGLRSCADFPAYRRCIGRIPAGESAAPGRPADGGQVFAAAGALRIRKLLRINHRQYQIELQPIGYSNCEICTELQSLGVSAVPARR